MTRLRSRFQRASENLIALYPALRTRPPKLFTFNVQLFPRQDFCISEFLLNFDRTSTRKQMNLFRKVLDFYVEGFRSMTLGRTLWAIILVKLFIMFAVLKVFFFPDLLAGKSPEEKADYVLENLTK